MLNLIAILIAALMTTTVTVPINATVDDPAASTEIRNPWIDCQDDMEMAVEKAGFDFEIFPLSNYTVSVIPDTMIQVKYPRNEFESIVIRKSPIVPESGDISGDFTKYPETDTLEIGGVEVEVRKDGDLIYAASFAAFDGAYSVSCSAGMTEAEVTSILEELLEANSK